MNCERLIALEIFLLCTDRLDTSLTWGIDMQHSPDHAETEKPRRLRRSATSSADNPDASPREPSIISSEGIFFNASPCGIYIKMFQFWVHVLFWFLSILDLSSFVFFKDCKHSLFSIQYLSHSIIYMSSSLDPWWGSMFCGASSGSNLLAHQLSKKFIASGQSVKWASHYTI